MTFQNKMTLFVIVLLGSVNAVCQCTNTTDSQPALSLKLQSVHDTVTLGDPVLVSVLLTNASKHEISIWRAPGFEYNVDVRDEKKNLAHDTELGRYRNGHVDFSKMRPEEMNTKYLNGSGACLTLKPGEQLNDEIDVGHLYELAPGKYVIQVSRHDEGTRKNVKSNAVTVVVLPKKQ